MAGPHARGLDHDGLMEPLAGVDIARELRYYSVRQFWVVVPLLFAALVLHRPRQGPA